MTGAAGVSLGVDEKTGAGAAERGAVLGAALSGPPGLVDDLAARRPRGVARDDVQDAWVLAVTGRFPHRLRTVPRTPETDDTGLPMEMVFADLRVPARSNDDPAGAEGTDGR